MENAHTTIGFGDTQISVFVGRAADDLVVDTVNLNVIVPQLLPAAAGKVESGESSVVVETLRPDGTPEQARVKTANTITATFVGKSNMRYPPMVRRGEQVLVYQFNGSDVYFWDSMGRDPELRTVDKLRIEVAAKTKLNEELTDDNAYFLEIDTITQHVQLKTSSVNGEKARYVLDLNPGEGNCQLGDDKGNSVSIDSVKSRVRVANAKKSMLDLLGEDIFVVGPRDVVLKAGRQVVADAPVFTQRSTTGGGVTLFQANALAIKAAQFVVDAGLIGLNGQTTVGGSLVVSDIVKALSYATGSGSAYGAATTSISDGSAAVPSNAANDAAASPAARHAAAVEQLVEIANLLVTLFGEINAATGAPLTAWSSLATLAAAAEMAKNSGE